VSNSINTKTGKLFTDLFFHFQKEESVKLLSSNLTLFESKAASFTVLPLSVCFTLALSGYHPNLFFLLVYVSDCGL